MGIRYNYANTCTLLGDVSLMSSSGVPAIAYIDTKGTKG